MLGRKVFTATKIVLEGDPAIALVGSNYREYMKDWNEEKHLKFLPGEVPTRFLIRQLTPFQKRAIEPLSGRDRLYMTIRCCLQGIENYGVEQNGVLTNINAPRFEDAGDLGLIITEEWMNCWNPNLDQLTGLSILGRLFSEPSLPLSAPSAPGAGPPDPSSAASTTT